MGKVKVSKIFCLQLCKNRDKGQRCHFITCKCIPYSGPFSVLSNEPVGLRSIFTMLPINLCINGYLSHWAANLEMNGGGGGSIRGREARTRKSALTFSHLAGSQSNSTDALPLYKSCGWGGNTYRYLHMVIFRKGQGIYLLQGSWFSFPIFPSRSSKSSFIRALGEGVLLPSTQLLLTLCFLVQARMSKGAQLCT